MNSRRQSVLAHLAMRFAPHPENLATEALGYILGRAASARTAMSGLLAELCGGPATDLEFETQVIDEEGARPDLLALDRSGAVVACIEVKFWAGLTANQPVGYLNSSQFAGRPGRLLVIAPDERLPTLWPELMRRVDEMAPDRQTAVQEFVTGARLASIGDHRMMLVGWRQVVGGLGKALSDADDVHALADLRQLEGLCEQMDSTAFLPLRSEELTGTLGRRVEDFCALADDLAQGLVASGEADAKGLRATGGMGYYGRYLRLHGYGAFLHFNAKLWARHGQSPLWLTMGFKDSPVKADWFRSVVPSLVEDGIYCRIPLHVPMQCEREAVLAALSTDVRAVARAIPFECRRVAVPPDVEELSSAADAEGSFRESQESQR